MLAGDCHFPAVRRVAVVVPAVVAPATTGGMVAMASVDGQAAWSAWRTPKLTAIRFMDISREGICRLRL